tara:strand:+ start:11465 stop:17710 length:6246 start_codon:yes stop_codon:yes gene_type:complete
MPKVKFPINRFRNGTVTSMSDRDNPPESPKQSHNVNPTAESGTLTPLLDDDILSIKTGWKAKDDVNIDSLESIEQRIDKMGIIDDNGTHRLVYYDDSTNKIGTINNVWSTNEDDIEPNTLTTVDTGSGVSMTNNNKEIHVGLGKNREPFWVGMIENKQFGNDYSEEITAENGVLKQPAEITALHKVVKATIDGVEYYYGIKWQGTRLYVFSSSTGLFIKKIKYRFKKTQALNVYNTGTEIETRLIIYDAGTAYGSVFLYDARIAEDKIDKTFGLTERHSTNNDYTINYKDDITDICYNHSTTSTSRKLWIYRPLLNEPIGRTTGSPTSNKIADMGKSHLWKTNFNNRTSGDIEFDVVRTGTNSYLNTASKGEWDIPEFSTNSSSVTNNNTDWFDSSSNIHNITSTQGSSPGSQNRFNTGSWLYPSQLTNAGATISGVENNATSDKWYPRSLVNPNGDNQGINNGSQNASTSPIYNRIHGTHTVGNGTSTTAATYEGNGDVNFVNFQQTLCKVDTKYGVYFIAGHKYYDLKNSTALSSSALGDGTAPSKINEDYNLTHWGGNNILSGSGYGKQGDDMPNDPTSSYHRDDDKDGQSTNATLKKRLGWFGGEVYSAGIFSENSDGYDRHVYKSGISYPSSNGAGGLEDGKVGNTTCVGPYFTHGKHGYVASDSDFKDGEYSGQELHNTHGKINRATVSKIFSPRSSTALTHQHVNTTLNQSYINAQNMESTDSGYKSSDGFNPFAGALSNHSTLGAGMAWGWIDIGYDNTIALEQTSDISGDVDTYNGDISGGTDNYNIFNSDDKRWRGSLVSDYLGTVFFLGYNAMQSDATRQEFGQGGLGMWSLRRKGYVHSDFYKNYKWNYRGKIIDDISNTGSNTENSSGAAFHREKISDRACLPSMMKVDSTNQLVFVGGKRRGSYSNTNGGMRNFVLSFNYELKEIDNHEIQEFDLSRGLNTADRNTLSADNFECFYLDEKNKVIVAGGGHPLNANVGNAGIVLIKYNENGEFIENTFFRIQNLSYVFAVDPIRKLIFTSEPANNDLKIREDTSSVYKYNSETLNVVKIAQFSDNLNYNNNINRLYEGFKTPNPCLHGSFYDNGTHASNVSLDYDYENRIIYVGKSTVTYVFTYDEDGKNFRRLKGHANINNGWEYNHSETMNDGATEIPELGQAGTGWKYNGEKFGDNVSYGLVGGTGVAGSTAEELEQYSSQGNNWKDPLSTDWNLANAANPHASIQLTYADYYGAVYAADSPYSTSERENGRPKNRAIICSFSESYFNNCANIYYVRAWTERLNQGDMSEVHAEGGSRFGLSVGCTNGFVFPHRDMINYTKYHAWGYGPKRQASPIHYAANKSPVMKNVQATLDYVTTPKTGLFVPSTDANKNYVALLYQAKNLSKIWEDNTATSGAHSGNSSLFRKYLVYFRQDISNSSLQLSNSSLAKMWVLDSETNVNTIDYENNKNLLITTAIEDVADNTKFYLAHKNETDENNITNFKVFTLPDETSSGFNDANLDTIDTDNTNNNYEIIEPSLIVNDNKLFVMSGKEIFFNAEIKTENDGSVHNAINQLDVKEIADADLILKEKSNETNTLNKGYKYFYKISYLYDGYQEGPLSESTFSIISTGKEIECKINIYNEGSLSKRVSHVLVYRSYSTDSESNEPLGFYRLIKQERLDTSWSSFNDAKLGTYYQEIFTDKGASGPSFESSAQIPEILDVVTPNYNLSTTLNSTHFIADISHPDIDKGSNMIVKSIPFQFNVFDITNDLLRLPSKPIALSNFNNRLYAFSNNSTYRIEPMNFSIEHTYKSVGCLGQDAVVSFDAGMAWADTDNIYLYDGNIPIPIGNAIKTGDIYSWDKRDKTVTPILEYSSKHKSIVVCWKYKNADTWYAWMYNIAMQRWDMANFFTKNQDHTTQINTAHTIRSMISGKDGNLIYQAEVDSNGDSTPNIESLYRFTSEIGPDAVGTATTTASYRDLKWKSNELTFGLDTQHKKILEIRVLSKNQQVDDAIYLNYFVNETGGASVLNIENSQIDDSSGTAYYLYKFKIPKTKSKVMSAQFEVVTKGEVVIDSIVVVYRLLMGSNENTSATGSIA